MKGKDTSVATVKVPLSYGSIKKLVSVYVSNGSGWGCDVMSFETQQSEVVLLNQMDKEELAKVLVELIKNNRELQRVILEVAWACPNIVTQI